MAVFHRLTKTTYWTALLGLACVAFVLLYQSPRFLRVDVGGNDGGLVSDFFDSERSPSYTFRWTKAQSEVNLLALGRGNDTPGLRRDCAIRRGELLTKRDRLGMIRSELREHRVKLRREPVPLGAEPHHRGRHRRLRGRPASAACRIEPALRLGEIAPCLFEIGIDPADPLGIEPGLHALHETVCSPIRGDPVLRGLHVAPQFRDAVVEPGGRPVHRGDLRLPLAVDIDVHQQVGRLSREPLILRGEGNLHHPCLLQRLDGDRVLNREFDRVTYVVR